MNAPTMISGSVRPDEGAPARARRLTPLADQQPPAGWAIHHRPAVRDPGGWVRPGPARVNPSLGREGSRGAPAPGGAGPRL